MAEVQEGEEVFAVALRHAQSDELLASLPSNKWSISSMAFSPSDRLLAVGGHDNLIRLWETATGKIRFVLRGHMAAVTALVFSPDGRTLASGSTDGTVKLWSVAAGQEMLSRRFPRGTVADLKFSGDAWALGAQFNDDDPSIESLRVPSWEEIQSAEAQETTKKHAYHPDLNQDQNP